jgi:hypothetical protein
MKKEARTLTGEQDRMFASAASAKRRAELAGRDASLALSIPTTGNTQEANLTGYLSRKTGGSFITQLSLALLCKRLQVLNAEPPKV